MNQGTKQLLLSIAETVDAWRLFPRLYLLTFITTLLSGHYWFIGLEEPTAQQVQYLQWVWGATAAATGFYVATGRKWGGHE